MYAELMNENVRIRAENVLLRKAVFALIAQADKDPFMSIGHFVEHGHALFSLAWYDASAYHSQNAREILAREFPGADFAAALDEFVKCETMPQRPGNLR